ncbi:NO-inducible flavohemoprotein [Shewanella sp. SW36]|uniref:NO-inducible flavohemoprotein n=1 Tax=Shewanella TaxID=22 RepID=UPI0021D87614|nr:MULTISPECIES: NO-inducible flavohemoprotein [unclassified Shewanella]MCU7976747.1 NO-inducible flavohemoprotein [Shewanella sp. SW36]MCU7991987.1 NO-inducible flavohemoprotein [Shewanella sp. SW1]MCU8016474.1 NO-inducible flavohemoprotein [Shewanella sp. SM72]MCU8053367.1 NO-inducible flavohemoprotein [Shewanella sp. SM43]
MLDSRTIQVIKSTIPLLESAGPALTTHFYERMFKHNPELKDVFNLAHQHSGGQPVALFNAVAAYAKNIENLAVLSSTVERIAQKHTGFLIKPEQYAIVGSHLLATLKELGGDAVTEEVLEAWAQAYGFLADIFIQREAQIYQAHAEQDGGWLGERQFIISAKKTESAVITSFILTPEDGKPVKDFIPGQYLSLKLKHPNLAYEEIRQYSLSDAPNGNSYRISVKRELGGQVSNLLHDTMHIGDKIAVMPPAGDFILEVGADIPVVLISAGVGQTPMKSMLNQLIKLQHPSAITWLHACEQGDVHGFKQAIHTKRQQHHNLKSHVWYRKPSSTDVVGTDYDFEGQMELSKVADQLLPHAHYYFCGPIGFMSAIKQQLLALGVSAENMHYEVFGPHADL